MTTISPSIPIGAYVHNRGLLYTVRLSSGWMFQGGSQSQKGRWGCKRERGWERESVCVCVMCAWAWARWNGWCETIWYDMTMANTMRRRRMWAWSQMRQDEIKKDIRGPKTRQAWMALVARWTITQQAGEYGETSGWLPEWLTALVAQFTLRVREGNMHGGIKRGERSCL